MAGLPYQRAILNPLEKPYSSDLNYQATESDATVRDSLRLLFAGRTGTGVAQDALANPQGFMADSFKLRPTGSPSMAVVVTAGTGLQDSPATSAVNIGGIVGVNDTVRSKWLYLSAPTTFTVPGNSSGSARVDLVEVAYRQGTQALADNQNRPILNPTTGVFTPTGVNTTLSPDLLNSTGTGTGAANANLYYKVGNPGSGAPATDAGYVVVGYVLVPTGATSIGPGGIIDQRVPLLSGGFESCVASVRVFNDLTPAAMDVFLAPPGWVVGCTGDGSIGGQGFLYGNLYIIAGASPSVALSSMSPGISNFVTSVTPVPPVGRVYAINNGTMSSGEVAELVNASLTSTPVVVAIGQPRLKVSFSTPMLSDGTNTQPLVLTANLKW